MSRLRARPTLRRRDVLALLIPMAVASAGTAQPPAPSPTVEVDPIAALDLEPELADRLRALDRITRELETLRAEFTQERFTALLKKPLTSSGEVTVADRRVLWQTTQPQPSTLLVADGEVQLYDPEAARLEVYQADARLLDVAASPLLRVGTLVEHFEVLGAEQAPGTDGGEAIRLQLIPRDPRLAVQVESVDLTLDYGAGHAERLEIFGLDGDRTVITFRAVELDAPVAAAEVALEVPSGTEIFRPQQ